LSLTDFLRPWTGHVYRHLPEHSALSALDFRFAGLGPDNRWNEPGEPTLYVASDAGVAVAEFARHVDRDYHPDLARRPLRRRLFRLHLQLEFVLDFCDPNSWAALGGLPNAPGCFLDRAIARAAARYVRVTTPAQAMRVPSVAFLDDLTRWSLVVFLDKLPADPRRFVQEVDETGLIHVGQGGGEGSRRGCNPCSYDSAGPWVEWLAAASDPGGRPVIPP
jgi:hypothetical protein